MDEKEKAEKLGYHLACLERDRTFYKVGGGVSGGAIAGGHIISYAIGTPFIPEYSYLYGIPMALFMCSRFTTVKIDNTKKSLDELLEKDPSLEGERDKGYNRREREIKEEPKCVCGPG